MYIEAYEHTTGGSPARGLANLSSINEAIKYVRDTAKEFSDLVRWDLTCTKSGKLTARWARGENDDSPPQRVK